MDFATIEPALCTLVASLLGLTGSDASCVQFENAPRVRNNGVAVLLSWVSTGNVGNASDEERWYLCTSSGWAPLGQVPSYLPPVLVNAALTVSTLGGFVLPSGYTPTVSALSFYVGASGTGGSTNATIRLSDGTLQCDFAFACNASTGAKRIAGSGAGCGSFTAGSTFTLSVVSIGDCAVGPTLTGNATVEALWR
jgi:hypothetical protein